MQNNSTRSDRVFGAAVLFMALSLTSNALAQQPLLPNLKPWPAFDIVAQLDGNGDPELRFAFLSWNNGAGPLEMIAGEVAQGRQNVYQRIYDDGGGYADRLAGDFVWHQGHNHFHFEDYALYVLPKVIGNSQRTSTKTSFCLMDSSHVNSSIPGSPSQAGYASCGNFFQGISVGWGDKYGKHLIGQEISLTNLQDGDYRLITTVDPENRLLESDETDNESCVLLRLTVSTPTPSVEVLNGSDCDGVEPDLDADGLPDSSDNCPNVQNTAAFPDSEGWAPQQDDDGDGIGNACDLVIPPQAVPSAMVGNSYNHTLAALRGQGPLSWILDSGSLPQALTFGSGGTISGDVIAGGFTSNFTARVTDSTGDWATYDLQIKSKIPKCYACHTTVTIFP